MDFSSDLCNNVAFSSSHDCAPELRAGFLALNASCPWTTTMNALVFCNSRLYVCSDAEEARLQGNSWKDEAKEVPVPIYDSQDEDTAEQHSKETVGDHLSKHSSQEATCDSRQRDELIAAAIKLHHNSYVVNVNKEQSSDLNVNKVHSSNLSEKELRNTVYRRNNSQLVNHYTNTAKHRKRQRATSPKNILLTNNREDDNYSSIEKFKRLVASPKIIHNEENSNKTDEGNKNGTQEKWTYCRPVLDIIHREVRFNYFNKIYKLKSIAKQIAEARDREKQQIAWNNIFDQLRNKYKSFGTDPEPAPPSIDWGTNSKLTKDYNESKFINKKSKRYKASKSERCKSILHDVFDFNPSGEMQPSYFHQNTDNFTITDDVISSPINLWNESSRYPLYLQMNPMNSYSDRNNTEMTTKLCTGSTSNIVTGRLFRNKSMCFPTASLTILQSETEQESRLYPQTTTSNNKIKFKTNVSKERISENKPMSMKTPIFYDYDQSPDVDTLLQSYMNHHKSYIAKAQRQTIRQKDERKCENSRNKMYYPIIKTCDANVNTETVISRRHLGYICKLKDCGLLTHESVSILNNRLCDESTNTTDEDCMLYQESQEPVSILKNIPCDESRNTIDVMVSKQDCTIHKAFKTLSENKPISYATSCSQASRNTRTDMNWNKNDELHGYKKWDRQRPRIIVSKSKMTARKPKSKLCAITTQTEWRSSFESIRCFVRHKGDLINSESDEEKLKKGKCSDSYDSENQFMLNPFQRKTSSKPILLLQNKETKCSDSEKYQDLADVTKSVLRNSSRPDTSAKIQEPIGEQLSHESKVMTSNASENQPNTSPKSDKPLENTEPRKYSGQLYISQITVTPPQPAIENGASQELQPNPDQITETNVPEANREFSMSAAIELSPYHTSRQQSSKETQPSNEMSLPQYTNSQQVYKENKMTPKEEYKKVAENVARLKAIHEERSNSNFYRGLDEKFNLLINSINGLVSQLKEKIIGSNKPDMPSEENRPTGGNVSDKNINEKNNKITKHNEENGTIYNDPSCVMVQDCRSTHEYSNTKVDTICPENDAIPLRQYNALKTDMGNILQTQASHFNIVTPNKNTIYCRNIKIEQILKDEMDKSDQAKRDIEDILNGDFHSQALQITLDIPTRECSTEVTASLSKTKVIPSDTQTFYDDDIIYSTSTAHGKINCSHLDKIRRNDNRNVQGQRCLTIRLDLIPLGILGLLRLSAQTIGRIMAFMQCQYNECFSLSPVSRLANQLVSPTQYVCNLCRVVISGFLDNRSHMQVEHRVPSVRDCCVCRHLLQVKNLRDHVGVFTCQYCGKQFTRSYCCELHQHACGGRLGMRPSVSESLAILQ